MSDEPSGTPTDTPTDDASPAARLSTTHRYDISRIWGRFRETDEAINGVRARVTGLEQRVSKIDDRLAEQRIMLLDLSASVRHVDHEVSAVRGDMTEIKNNQRGMVGTLERFTVDQGIRGQARTESMNVIVRTLIGIFAALGVISVSIVSLVAMAGEHDISLLNLLAKLFGFGG
jgi:hypothetical protein